MSRKLVAGFRALLNDVCTTWMDAGYQIGYETEEANEKRANRAKRKLERLVLNILLPAYHATRHQRAGYTAPPAIEWLSTALQTLEREARMNGRRFTAGHSERTKRRPK